MSQVARSRADSIPLATGAIVRTPSARWWRPWLRSRTHDRPGRALSVLFALARHLDYGGFDVELGGRTHTFRGRHDGPVARFVVHDQRFAMRFLLGGSVGVGESWIDGDWSTDNLALFLEVAARNQQFLDRFLHGRLPFRILKRLRHGMRRNTRAGSKRNIAFHYDLGNTFYERWLDAGMNYSSALFEGDGDDLAAAQQRKHVELASRLDLSPGMHVLEIGCGWGDFACHLARAHDVRVTAVTISPAQYEGACARVQQAGLGDRVEIRLTDYRDVAGTFDRIASIEMFEAVGEAYWQAFFTTLRDRLKPDGRAALQVITIAEAFFEDYRADPDFIQTYIFPGGMLPTPTHLRSLSAAAGLKVTDERYFGLDYARTLAIWRHAFEQAWPDLSAQGFDERFAQLWRFYLAYCEAGFRAGCIDVGQTTLIRA